MSAERLHVEILTGLADGRTVVMPCTCLRGRDHAYGEPWWTASASTPAVPDDGRPRRRGIRSHGSHADRKPRHAGGGPE